jgi:hypothetical protein
MHGNSNIKLYLVYFTKPFQLQSFCTVQQYEDLYLTMVRLIFNSKGVWVFSPGRRRASVKLVDHSFVYSFLFLLFGRIFAFRAGSSEAEVH